MNNYQNAKRTSYRLIIIEARNHQESVNKVLAFAQGIDRLETIVGEIDAIGVQQAKDIKGITENKNAMLDVLRDETVDVAGAVYAYAVASGNKELAAKVNFKESTLSKMKAHELVTAAAIVLEEAAKLTPEVLTERGISAAELTSMNEAYTKYRKANDEPREAVIDRSGHTQKLTDLFDEAAELKKSTLDRLIAQFKRKSPDFYEKYQAAANVLYRHYSKTNSAQTDTNPTPAS
jgi:hypothetical protein